MSVPVPPLVVRRVLRDPLWPVLLGALALLLGLLALPLLVLEPWRRRNRALRLVRLAVAGIAADLGILLGCWWLWLRHPPWRRDPVAWREQHTALLDRRLTTVLQVAERTVGLQLRTDIPPVVARTPHPLLVLSRHIGSGDSLLVAYLVAHTFGRTPRVMLKRFLLWDAAADLLLNRLGSYFLPPRRVNVAERDRRLEAFARSLDAHDALILFPEGGNWSPRRHAASIEWAEQNGNPALQEWIRDHPRVLVPRAKGTQQMLEDSPDLVPVIIAHHGLDRTGSLGQIWRAVPLAHPVDVVVRVVDRPRSSDLEVVDLWLREHWSQIDRWAGELATAVGEQPPPPSRLD
ncbi:1-acyl-sn-glycerol-3-phosphate acyltransferase [Barrientosiimonas humi]|uniref:1-acyl-sn-glycerol-3-phosphate acyltransferase n=1 Tax=Barrientosiimonas humi TaxID=999931 RepID=UPI00370D18EA